MQTQKLNWNGKKTVFGAGRAIGSIEFILLFVLKSPAKPTCLITGRVKPNGYLSKSQIKQKKHVEFFAFFNFMILFTRIRNIHSRIVAINHTSQVDAMILCMVCVLFLLQTPFSFCRILKEESKEYAWTVNTTKKVDDGCVYVNRTCTHTHTDRTNCGKWGIELNKYLLIPNLYAYMWYLRAITAAKWCMFFSFLHTVLSQSFSFFGGKFRSDRARPIRYDFLSNARVSLQSDVQYFVKYSICWSLIAVGTSFSPPGILCCFSFKVNIS